MFDSLLKKANKYKFEILVFLLWLVAILCRSVFLSNYAGGRDIFFQYLEALNIKQGINPYERIVGQDLRINQKFPTFFPSSYLFLSFITLFSGNDFVLFCFLLRCISLCLELVISLLMLKVCKRYGFPLVGVGSVIFWLFSRWSIYNFAQVRLDAIAISLAFIAIFLYKKTSRIWPFLVMSFSLAIKHLGVFMLPLFLFDSLREKKWGQLLSRAFLLISVPAASALPYFAENPAGFLFSLGFSFTRQPETSNIGYGWDVITNKIANNILPLTGLVGTFPGTMLYYFSPRLPLFTAFFLLMLFAYLGKWGKYTVALVGMLVFLSFNPVIFSQYYSWVIPFILISGIETFSRLSADLSSK